MVQNRRMRSLALLLVGVLMAGCGTAPAEPSAASTPTQEPVVDENVTLPPPATTLEATCRIPCGADVDPDGRGGEPAASIDPTDPDRMIVAAITGSTPPVPAGPVCPGVAFCVNAWQYPGWAYLVVHSSLDAGATWSTTEIPYATTAPPESAWSRYCVTADPVVFFDEKGVAYLFGLGWLCSNGVLPSYTAEGHVWMATSTDHGATWSEPTVVYRNFGFVEWPDKEWAALEPGTGRMVAAWLGLPAGALEPSKLRVTTSTDRGASWSEATVVTDSEEEGGFGQYAPVPVFGPDGRIHVVYRGCAGGCIKVASSDDGAIWRKSLVADAKDTPRQGPQQTMQNFPSIAVGEPSGRLFVAWHADAADGSKDAYAAWSDDNGTTWSMPHRLHDNPVGDGTDQFLPWIASDGQGGVYAFFYDRRADPEDNRLTQAYFAWFHPEYGLLNRNASEPWDPAPSDDSFVHYGDYEAAASVGSRALIAWTQQNEYGLKHVHSAVFETVVDGS